MIEYVDPHSIKPAEYNPRKIDKEDFDNLCLSVQRLGIIVPLYANLLNEQGFNILTLEFYHNNKKGVNIDRANREIDSLIHHLSNKGLFDFIVLDSVLNSVDSLEAEQSVMGTCNALLKDGGTLFFSGRTLKAAKTYDRQKKVSSDKNSIYFLDKDGFSATFRNGNFYYQKFHDDDQIKKLIVEHGFVLEDFKKDGSAWRCKVKKERQSPYCISGLNFEFNLPHPKGRYGRSDEVIQAFSKAVKNTR